MCASLEFYSNGLVRHSTNKANGVSFNKFGSGPKRLRNQAVFFDDEVVIKDGVKAISR